MLTRLFLLIVFVLSMSLAGADDVERLSSAKKSLQSGDEIEQFRGYNECKTIYLRAILDKNSVMAREALEGIVQGGEKLGIDVSKYEADLAKLPPASGNVPKIGAPDNSVEIAIKPAGPVLKLPRLAPVKPFDTPSKFLTPAPETLFPLQLKRLNEVSMAMRHRLLDTKWKDNGLELIFDAPVKIDEIKMSKIIESDKQRFRYIIDIDSATLSKSQILEHKEISRIKMAQFDAKTVRLVIEHTQAISIKYTPKGSSLYVDLSLEPPTATAPLATAPVVTVQAPPLLAALPPLVSVTPRDRSKKIIMIDAGHGGKDSGAVGNGFMEKEIVIQIATQFAEKLRAMGYTVHMTRSNDTFVELKDRTKYANDQNADLFVSIHANSIPKNGDPVATQGIETYFLSPARSERSMRVAALENSEDMEEMGQYGKLSFLSFLNKEKILASNKLAIDLQKGMLSNLRKLFPNVHDNGVREAPFWVLVGAQMPAVLVEVGYVSNPEEALRITDEKYQKWMIEGLVEGVGHYFVNNSI